MIKRTVLFLFAVFISTIVFTELACASFTLDSWTVLTSAISPAATGGSISGRVTYNGNPVVNMAVNAFDAGPTGNYGGAFTDATGNYTIAGLPAGNYKVGFDGPSAGYIGQWYNNASNISTATVITVGSTPVLNINAALVAGGSISGRVTYNGNPVVNMAVNAFDAGPTGNYGGAFTDATGNYTIAGLPAGNYKVGFDGPSAGYIGQWYNNAPDSATAAIVSVTIGLTTSGINAAMMLGGSISGRVTDSEGLELQGVSAHAYDAVTGSFINSAQTDASGVYTVKGLTPGNYKIYFDGTRGYIGTLSGGYLNSWYKNSGDETGATGIAVTKGLTTSNIDAVLLSGGGISGTVKNADGTGIPNILIKIYDPSTNVYVGAEHTDSLGNYIASGLSAGSYMVFFTASGSSNYIGQWFSGASYLNSATTVLVNTGEVLLNVNAILVPGGIIAGTVTDGTSPIQNVPIDIYEAGTGTAVVSGLTNSFGNYSIEGLPAGNYKVFFGGVVSVSSAVFDTNYLPEWYNNASNMDSATAVNVTVPDTTFGIDASLTLSATVAITASCSKGGTISPGGEITADLGSNIIFYITPQTGYSVADVLVDGISMGPIHAVTFMSVSSKHTIAVTFGH